MTLVEAGALDKWLAAHPGGIAVDRYSNRWRGLPRQPDRVFDYPGKQLGLRLAPAGPPVPADTLTAIAAGDSA